jgi:hypothetical protein
VDIMLQCLDTCFTAIVIRDVVRSIQHTPCSDLFACEGSSIFSGNLRKKMKSKTQCRDSLLNPYFIWKYLS